MRKHNVLVIALFLWAVFIAGCGQTTAPEEFYLEETFEIVWPEELITMAGFPAEEQALSMLDAKDKNVCTDVWVNDDNTLTVTLTEEQRQNMMRIVREGLTGFIESYEKNDIFTTEYDNDYKTVAFYVNEHATWDEVGGGIILCVDEILFLQLYDTKNGEDLRVLVRIYNGKNQKLITEGYMPGDGIDITPEMWQNSESSTG